MADVRVFSAVFLDALPILGTKDAYKVVRMTTLKNILAPYFLVRYAVLRSLRSAAHALYIDPARAASYHPPS